MTIPVGLASLTPTYGPKYAETTASAILGALPLLTAFLLHQRHITQTITTTGIK